MKNNWFRPKYNTVLEAQIVHGDLEDNNWFRERMKNNGQQWRMKNNRPKYNTNCGMKNNRPKYNKLKSSHLLQCGRPVMICSKEEEEEQGLGVAEEEERRLGYSVAEEEEHGLGFKKCGILEWNMNTTERDFGIGF